MTPSSSPSLVTQIIMWEARTLTVLSCRSQMRLASAVHFRSGQGSGQAMQARDCQLRRSRYETASMLASYLLGNGRRVAPPALHIGSTRGKSALVGSPPLRKLSHCRTGEPTKPFLCSGPAERPLGVVGLLWISLADLHDKQAPGYPPPVLPDLYVMCHQNPSIVRPAVFIASWNAL